MTAKVRPCVVISTRIGDVDRAIVTLIPHTASIRDTSFEAAVRTHFLKPGAFNAQGILTVPVSRASRLLGSLDNQQMYEVEMDVCRWLDLQCGK